MVRGKRLATARRQCLTWQRPMTTSPVVLEHLPLGNSTSPAATPSCADVLRLAGRVPAGGRLAAARAPAPIVANLAPAPAMNDSPAPAAETIPLSDGTSADALPIRLAIGGRYGVWVGGSFQGRLEMLVDGQRVAADRQEANYGTPLVPLGEADLAAGEHRITVRYAGADSHPGSGAPSWIAPLVVAAPAAARPIVFAKPSRARELCSRPLDWIEVLGRSG